MIVINHIPEKPQKITLKQSGIYKILNDIESVRQRKETFEGGAVPESIH